MLFIYYKVLILLNKWNQFFIIIEMFYLANRLHNISFGDYNQIKIISLK